MHTLSVKTPVLLTLSARACSRLEAVRLAAAPQRCDLSNCCVLQSLEVDTVFNANSSAVAEVELTGCCSMSSWALTTVQAWATHMQATESLP